MDSLAIIERGYLYPTPATSNGIKSDCVFCIAKHIDEYRVGDLGMVLQGGDAGRLLHYQPKFQATGEASFLFLGDHGASRRLLRDHLLTVPLEVLTIPLFLPPLSLRNCFVIDELANWFCSQSLCGLNFHWCDSRVIEAARTIWERRIPIYPQEMSQVLLAHGMPSLHQTKFEELFDFAVRTLVATKGRPALKKLRREETGQETLWRAWDVHGRASRSVSSSEAID